MALFKRLFGGSKPAPKVPIHPEDQSLVSAADNNWWSALTLEDCRAIEEQDNIFKMAALVHHVEEEGLSEEDAARRVRKSFPTYYGNLADRADEPLGFAGDDAKLPYVLKDRVNRAVMGTIASMDKRHVEAASSVNALVRRLIRDGRI